ncbi:TetR/AcrR family transcriptional regulator [Amycolatopsis pithecellobii]|uniref:TetR family transcriptional regulator n=1 Tax=Amycolatopsis pithecellobii TaxID=664692 RepID=A0A6N7ZAC3_9PSEU|nr:TetR/AcrR family transcriptional regulator C-terminal domain-containing protein [Amycolatopsis pithecellobii]MTD58691.1 TetR family transcriptional regulator [Amycolatopsis pithecellobii]
MATKARRTDALSRELIIEAAIQILDTDGEDALTLRALTIRLSTGYGALYHHVANKSDLLLAAADDVIARVMTDVAEDAEPRERLRAVALSLFDAINAHPWIGAQLSREPWQPALLEIYESIGEQLEALNVPEQAMFDSAGALVNYILGVAGQNAANARVRAHTEGDRTTSLAAIAAQWAQLDPGKYPRLHKTAAQLREHDDRRQFLAGIELFLAGIETVHRKAENH